MHIRHIDPRSEEWAEAMGWTETGEKLSPEEAARLRHMLAVEHATLGMPPIDLQLPSVRRRGKPI